MSTLDPARRQSDPGACCIHTSGRLPEGFPEVFGGFSVKVVPGAGGADLTELSGTVADQTALLSLLQYLDDTGLVLLSVETLEVPAAEGPAGSPISPGGIES
jgi:hypothetical protein